MDISGAGRENPADRGDPAGAGRAGTQQAGELSRQGEPSRLRRGTQQVGRILQAERGLRVCRQGPAGTQLLVG